MIRFPTEHLTDQVDHIAHATLLDLFNKKTPVQLLCHLAPQACRTGVLIDSTDDALLPLDSFLFSVHDSLLYPTNDQLLLRVALSHQEVLDDIHAVISNASMTLERKNPFVGLYPFCLPQLQVHPSESAAGPGSAADSENRARFSLTLTYDLLRSHPTMMTRYLKEDTSLTVTHAKATSCHHGLTARMKWIMAGLFLLFVVGGVRSWIVRGNKEGSPATLVAQEEHSGWCSEEQLLVLG